MICAMLKVLPEPVTPNSVWYLYPFSSPSTSRSMAWGWSPARNVFRFKFELTHYASRNRGW